MKLIDTDVLFAQMEEHYGRRVKEANMMGDRAICATWNDAIFLIKSAPTVDAEPVRHGKWIRKKDTRFGEMLNDILICSECRIAFSTVTMPRRSYCPNCGARMSNET